MEKGNEHIQQLEEKKSSYKKQILSLKNQNSQHMGNKDTILKKQDEQIQEKIKELTERQS